MIPVTHGMPYLGLVPWVRLYPTKNGNWFGGIDKYWNGLISRKRPNEWAFSLCLQGTTGVDPLVLFPLYPKVDDQGAFVHGHWGQMQVIGRRDQSTRTESLLVSVMIKLTQDWRWNRDD